MTLNRRDLASLLLVSLLPGCSLFREKKPRLPGERISVLGLDSRLRADAKLADTPVVLPPPVVNAGWPDAGGYPDHAMYHLALPQNLTQAWSTSIGEGTGRYTQVLAQPVVDHDRVYVMDGGVQVSALDARTGKKIWQVDLKPKGERGNAFGGGPAFWQGRLYVGTGFAEVVALDAATGKIIWRHDISGPTHAQPTVSDGRIFVITVENELDVLATSDGRRLWTHNGIPETADLLGGASPAVSGEIVVVPYSSGELYALRSANGRALWSHNLVSERTMNAVSSLADIRGRPIIDRDRVIAVSHSGRMVSIDLRSGGIVWDLEIGSSYSPWVAGNYVFVISDDNEIVCLTRDDGQVRWLRELQHFKDPKHQTGPIRWAGPALGSNRLIVLSSDGNALSVSPYTGAPLGQQRISSSSYIGPVIADETLYLLTDDATLAAYR
jgi:outer membrane protein assembly factor BamB